LPLFYRARPSVTGGWLPAANVAPVVVELDRHPTPDDVTRLERAGLSISSREDGSPVVRDAFVSGWATAEALSSVAAVARVIRVVADGASFGLLPPRDVIGPQLRAPDAWRQLDPYGYAVTGVGQVVCVVDVGMDVLHPMFFHADGGFWGWRDVDRDGTFSDGVDTLSDGTVLRSLNSLVFDFQGGTLFGTENGQHIAGIDWVYADVNGNGKRDVGAEAGYSDLSPSMGEPLFTSDDVNGNAVLDFGERLVALGTSKVQFFNTGAFIHSRGVDMNQAPREGSYHGTASTSIIAGGQRGFGRFVGIAPDAELIMVRTSTTSRLFNHTDYCLARGARVILHEYAPWQGFFLDGSSPLEQVIADTMQAGVAHINPAGNLAGAQKVYKRELARGATTDILIEVPPAFDEEPYALFAFSLLWQGNMEDLEVTLTDGAGVSMLVPDDLVQQGFHSGLLLTSLRDESTRGTARVDVAVFSDQDGSVKLTPGSWKVSVRDRAQSGPYELLATVSDDQSRWDVGIHFPEFANEEHLVGHPGTADAAIVVADYVGHGFAGGTPGARSAKSGRGTRFDGMELISVAAPEDPIAAGYFEKHVAPMGPFSGTSGASPHVAGAAALLFQADSTLTGIGVRDALRAGALSDYDTGFVPNLDWGYGKLRIYNSLYGEDPPLGTAPSVSIPVTHIDAGDSTTIRASITDAEDPLDVLLIELDRNYDGLYDEQLADGSFRVSFDKVGPHFLKVRVTDPSGRTGVALARVDVHTTYVLSGGLACSFSAFSVRRGGQAWPWALFFLCFGGCLFARIMTGRQHRPTA
jgi:subtilisin family serine protease